MNFLSRNQIPADLLQESVTSQKAKIRAEMSKPGLSQPERDRLRAQLQTLESGKDYSQPASPEGIDPRNKGVVFR